MNFFLRSIHTRSHRKSIRKRKMKMNTSALGFDWNTIKKAVMDSEEHQNYLGSCLSLTPSGKYYNAYANSNVEVCDACGEQIDLPCDESTPCTGSSGDPLTGKGHCEACKDAAWYKALENEANECGLYVVSGDDDPCDLFVGRD